MPWDQRHVFVTSHVTKVRKGKNTAIAYDSRINFTFIIRLNNGNETFQVCRQMFLNTLGINYRMAQHWVTKNSTSSENEIINKVSVMPRSFQRVQLLKDFIKSLPKLPSYYGRQH